MPAFDKSEPAAIRRERKKREEARWQRILAWYMMQQWADKQAAELKKYEALPLRLILNHFVKTGSLRERLREKTPGRRSCYELLEDMDRYQEEDSPCRKLLQTLRETPPSDKKIDAAIAECIQKVPERILDRERKRNSVYRAPGGMIAEPLDPARQAEADRRLEYEMGFLRAMLPPELFRRLCAEMARQGRLVDPEKDFQYVPDPEPGAISYPEYADRHRVMPEERDGELANRDAVFTAAAYLLAAWEQKDAKVFDERKADARAMELAASRAFRTYMNQQPGSLLAAARNVGLDFTHDAMTAMEAAFAKRDASLLPARDALKKAAAGKSAAFRQMVNALDRFVEAEEEPPRDQRDSLRKQLAEYALRQTSPDLAEGDRTCTLYALSALRALSGAKEFSFVLDTVNSRQTGKAPICPEELDALEAKPADPAPRPEPQPAPML